MSGPLLALLWLGVVVAALAVVLALAGLLYVAVLIKRAGFTELFRRLGSRDVRRR